MSGDGGVEEIHAFFRRMHEHYHDPEVAAAVDNLWELMREAETALGHRITPRQWLDDRWMESWGLIEANNRLLRAVHACTVRGVADVIRRHGAFGMAEVKLADRDTLSIPHPAQDIAAELICRKAGLRELQSMRTTPFRFPPLPSHHYRSLGVSGADYAFSSLARTKSVEKIGVRGSLTICV
jgi:hypothetical protein